MSIRPSLYRVLTIKKDGKTVDFRLAATSIDFYEDVLCPTVSCTIQIANSGGAIKSDESGKYVSLYEGMKLRKGEEVELYIQSNSATNQDLDYATKRSLFVNDITELIRDDRAEFFKLHLFSKEAYMNEMVFLEKKYGESTRISDHVETIINESFQSSIEKDIDTTSVNYGFWGSQMKPFEAIMKLASKANSEGSLNTSTTGPSSAGFFFYQTRRGFAFKSIDNLVAQSVDVPKYVYTEYNGSPVDFKPRGDLISLDYKINHFVINQAGSLAEDLRKGVIASARRFFDPVSFNVTVDNIFSQDDYGTIPTLGERISEETPKLGNIDLSKFPTKIITETFDKGTANPEVSTKNNLDQTLYSSQRKMRYNSLFSQSVSIQVPLNTNLHAGDLIDCVFASIGDSDLPEPDRTQISGIYMIKELCHHYDPRTSYTSMMLTRDTYGERQK
jgi:hypothetical protein